MQVTRREIPNNSPEQVMEYLERAMRIADDLTSDPETWAVVFAQAVPLLSGKQIIMEQAPTLPLGQILENGRR